MKIKEEERQDKYGEYPACWVKSADLTRLQEWLFNNFNGYKFAVVFDCMKDEYEEAKEMPVYFLDCVSKELIAYAGKDAIKRELEEL